MAAATGKNAIDFYSHVKFSGFPRGEMHLHLPRLNPGAPKSFFLEGLLNYNVRICNVYFGGTRLASLLTLTYQ